MKFNFFKLTTLVLFASLMMTTSCSNEEFDVPSQENSSQLPKDILSKIKDLKMNPDKFRVDQILNFDGGMQTVVIFDDIAMEKSRFLEIPTDKDGLSKQYQTEFLIDTDLHPEINIIVYTGEAILDGDTVVADGLSESAQQGVRDAVENWNSVSRTKINLKVDFSTATTFDPDFYEIAISVAPNFRGFGGMADFPDADGNPGDYVLISPGANAAVNVADGIEHLLTHEIGHALGFRHTDWNSRQSCVDLEIEDAPRAEPNPPSIIFGTLQNGMKCLISSRIINFIP